MISLRHTSDRVGFRGLPGCAVVTVPGLTDSNSDRCLSPASVEWKACPQISVSAFATFSSPGRPKQTENQLSFCLQPFAAHCTAIDLLLQQGGWGQTLCMEELVHTYHVVRTALVLKCHQGLYQWKGNIKKVVLHHNCMYYSRKLGELNASDASLAFLRFL